VARSKDVDAVEEDLGRFARKSAVIRRLTKNVLKTQRALQRIVSERAWRAYLAVEEAANARDDKIVSAAIRIAFRHGARNSR